MRQKNLPLTDREVEQVKTMAGLGLTMEKIAAVLDMSKETLERRLKKNPAARDALEKGRAMAELNVAKSAYDQAISGKTPAMTMFYLKCRAGWKETQVTEHTVTDPLVIELPMAGKKMTVISGKDYK